MLMKRLPLSQCKPGIISDNMAEHRHMSQVKVESYHAIALKIQPRDISIMFRILFQMFKIFSYTEKRHKRYYSYWLLRIRQRYRYYQTYYVRKTSTDITQRPMRSATFRMCLGTLWIGHYLSPGGGGRQNVNLE